MTGLVFSIIIQQEVVLGLISFVGGSPVDGGL
jgi:hypothetical protein